MTFITQKDFETRAGQEKIIKAIHNLDLKVHELELKLQMCVKTEHTLERGLGGYEMHEGRLEN